MFSVFYLLCCESRVIWEDGEAKYSSNGDMPNVQSVKSDEYSRELRYYDQLLRRCYRVFRPSFLLHMLQPEYASPRSDMLTTLTTKFPNVSKHWANMHSCFKFQCCLGPVSILPPASPELSFAEMSKFRPPHITGLWASKRDFVQGVAPDLRRKQKVALDRHSSCR